MLFFEETAIIFFVLTLLLDVLLVIIIANKRNALAKNPTPVYEHTAIIEHHDTFVNQPLPTIATHLEAPVPRNVPVLMYHHIGIEYNGYLQEHPDRTDNNVVTPEDFEIQIKYLFENGYSTCFFREISNQECNDKAIILTFDDGYRDFYFSAFPVLKKYQSKATIFVITDLIGQDNYLTLDQILELKQSGLINFGSHTASHPALTSVNTVKLESELLTSKTTLEQITGQSVTDFCYPGGSYNEAVIQAVKKAGYLDAVTTVNGKWNFPATDSLQIKRIRVSFGEKLPAYIQSIAN